jgi:hypothetical protein
MTEEVEPRYQAFHDQMSGGPGLEVLALKCPHRSLYSAIHSVYPVVPQESVDQARDSLQAYYETVADCGCAVVVMPD